MTRPISTSTRRAQPAAEVVLVERPEALTEHLPAWRTLRSRSLEDNVFLSPDLVLPLIEHDGATAPVRLAFVYAGADMIAAAAFAPPQSGVLAIGTTALATWEHPLFLDATPLLDRDRAATAAAALQAWLEGPAGAWSFVRWARVRLDSAAWAHLAAAADAHGRGWWARRVYRRPALRVPASWDDYLGGLSRSRRKGLRRIERKLAASGTVRERLHRTTSPDLVDRFLALEAAGWKGAEGTALASDPGQERFFRAAVAALGERHGVCWMELCLDDRPIAISVNFVDGETLWAYKSAYDPALAELSPGVAAEAALVRASIAEGTVRRIDSCAEEDSHLGGLWRERLAIGEILVATDTFAGLSMAAVPRVRRTRAAARGVWQRLRRAAG